MDIRMLEYFLTVAECESVSEAAKKLFIAQSTLSHQIIQLEEELGVTLFEPGVRKMVLSEEGLLFERRAEEMLSLADKAKREINEKNGLVCGRVTIGCDGPSAVKTLSALLRTFSLANPLASYGLYCADPKSVRESLDSGITDIALLGGKCKSDGLASVPVMNKEGAVVILKSGDPLADKKSVSPSDLAARPLIMPGQPNLAANIRTWLGEYYDESFVKAETNMNESVPLLVQAGLGYGFLTESLAALLKTDPASCRPLTGYTGDLQAFYWKKDRAMSTTLIKFVEHLKLYYADSTD